jgi:hypothetical protein
VASPTDRLKEIVDEACQQVRYGKLSKAEAEELARKVRREAEHLVPDQMATYDLLYEARFRRLIEQFVTPRMGEDSSGGEDRPAQG